MEDILASIRRIMADDDVPPSPTRHASERSAPNPTVHEPASSERAARPAAPERRRSEGPEPAERAARRPDAPAPDPRDAARRAGPPRPAAGDRDMRARARQDLEDLSDHLAAETLAAHPASAGPLGDEPPTEEHLAGDELADPPGPPARERGRHLASEASAPRMLRDFERRATDERFEAQPHRAARLAELPAERSAAAADSGEPRRPPRPPAPDFRTMPRPAKPVPGEPAAMDHPAEDDERARRRDLLSPNVDDVVAAAFQSLGDLLLPQKQRTIEDLVKEILRPMLKDWLDQNLPDIVERLVRAEIERVARRPR